jgi:aldose 1-epimerase
MRQVEIAGDDVEVVVLPEVGARLHAVRAFGHEVLRAPLDAATHRGEPFFWGAYVMAPWCNRIAAAPTPAAGRVVDLPSNFADGTAIHGQVYGTPWTVEGQGRFSVRGGGDGWPWEYEVGMRVEVEGPVLRLGLELVNASDRPMPGGLGLHPWFVRPLRAAIRGATVFERLDEVVPARPVAGPLDRRAVAELPAGLDNGWTDLADPAVELEWPGLGLRADLRFRAARRHVVAATPVDPDATAIEPQTHAPQGLARLLAGDPDGLALIEPGGSLALGIELAFDRLH